MHENQSLLFLSFFFIFFKIQKILRKLEKCTEKNSGKTRGTEGTFSGRSVMLLGEGGGNCNLKKKTHICMSSLAFTWSDAVVKEITDGVKERSSLYSSYRNRGGRYVEHRAHRGVEQKQGKCTCPLSWSVHHNLYVMVDIVKRGWTWVWANISIMIEYTPESGRCHSVYSVLQTHSQAAVLTEETIYLFLHIQNYT